MNESERDKTRVHLTQAPHTDFWFRTNIWISQESGARVQVSELMKNATDRELS